MLPVKRIFFLTANGGQGGKKIIKRKRLPYHISLSPPLAVVCSLNSNRGYSFSVHKICLKEEARGGERG
jgi:hypothetical protein